jgi:hypothetical protein
MLGSKINGRVFDAKSSRFVEKITFSSFYPSRLDAQEFLDNAFDGGDGSIIIVEGEVVEFKDGQLTVAYETFLESAPF